MIPILYKANATDFDTIGIGFLQDCVKCEVTEERNGIFEADIEYPLSGVLASEIEEGKIVKIKVNDQAGLQLFRIYQIDKPIVGNISVHLCHISYDLIGYPVINFATVPITADATIKKLFTDCEQNKRFSASADALFTEKRTLSIVKPCSVRNALGGMEGSILDLWHGEYEFDNFEVTLHKNRGADNGVTIIYGKNLTEMDSEITIENCYTHILPYAMLDVGNDNDEDSDKNQVAIKLVPNPILAIENAPNLGTDRVLTVDLTDSFGDDEEITPALLLQKTKDFVKTNNLTTPDASLNVNFVPIWQTEEYKDIAPLERIGLCDTVTVKHKPMGINLKLKCNKYVFDSLKERYVSMELGTPKSNFSSTLLNVDFEIGEFKQTIQEFKVGEGEFRSQITEITTDQNGKIKTMQSTIEQLPDNIKFEVTTQLNNSGVSAGLELSVKYANERDADGNLTYRLDPTSELNMWANQVTINSDDFNLSNGQIKAGHISDGTYANLYTDGISFYYKNTKVATFTGNSWEGNESLRGVTIGADDGASYIGLGHIDNGVYMADLTLNYGVNDGARVQIGGSVNISDWLHVNNSTTINGNLDCSSITTGSISAVGDIVVSNDCAVKCGDKYLYPGGLVLGEGDASEVTHFYPDELFINSGNIFCKNVNCENIYIPEGGNKAKIVSTEHYGTRNLYAYEMAEPYFGDMGEAKTDKDGFCTVPICCIFAETVYTDLQYMVFLQSREKSRVWVKRKNAKSFLVQSEEPYTAFDWEIKAHQKRCLNRRLEVYNG